MDNSREKRNIDVIDVNTRSRITNNENYIKMQEKSVNGTTARRNHKKRKTKSSVIFKRNKKLLGAAVGGAIAALGVGNVANTMIDNSVINGLAREFHSEVVRPETHRTNDNKNYFYDYGDILQTMKEMDDFDEAVFLLSECIGEEQTSIVLRGSDYESFAGYMETKGYKDSKDFAEDMRGRILIETDIEDNKRELDTLLADVSEDDNVDVLYSGFGGKWYGKGIGNNWDR